MQKLKTAVDKIDGQSLEVVEFVEKLPVPDTDRETTCGDYNL